MNTRELLHYFDPSSGHVVGAAVIERRLSDLRGCFADAEAYAAALAQEDPLLYAVASVESADGDGDLHYGVGRLMPGRVGDEYYMTKGHLHRWREAAEVYVGLSGEGAMLLENATDGECRLVELRPHAAVYVPGHTLHRTINTGDAPLIYLGIYPAKAGHDYGTIAAVNFRNVVVHRNGRPTLLERKKLHVELPV
jgi:glucose-6-phosphate isomerase, archaeal